MHAPLPAARTRELVILGAGTAGTLLAAHLAPQLPPGWRLTLIDPDPVHVYQPGLLFVPFEVYTPEGITRPRHATLPAGVRWIQAPVAAVSTEPKRLRLAAGEELPWDVLVVATGTRTLPEALDGLTGDGWRSSAHDFYTLDGAVALRDALRGFRGGRVVINPVEMPIKCPVAPLEMAFLLEAAFTRAGMRDDVELRYVTPLDGAFTKPVAAARLGGLLKARGIEVVPEFAAGEVVAGPEGGELRSHDDRAVPFELLISTPPHRGAALWTDHPLADDSGFLRTHRNTLQSLVHEDVFALGDATDLPTSKAGSVAHFQGEVLVGNLLRHLRGQALRPDFDGHANCFVETGHDKAILLDFNYDTQPLPGEFPLPGVGPFTLLGESRINHMGKMAFQWVYWNLLLTGKGVPMDPRMLRAGKHEVAPGALGGAW